MIFLNRVLMIYFIVSTVNLVDLAFLMKMEGIISNTRSVEMLSHPRDRRDPPEVPQAIAWLASKTLAV